MTEPKRPRSPTAADPLDGVRPGGRRSFWLREALVAEGPELAADLVAPPFAGESQADVAILGGGYTGLWTAIRLRELDPSVRVVVLEQDICGGGPSGRNGGFVTGWWDELPGLITRFGEAEAVRIAQAMDQAIDDLVAFTRDAGIADHYRHDGFLQVSAAPAQDDAWQPATEACERLGHGERWRAVSADEVRAIARSPVFRSGAFMPHAGIVQPAMLARALRRKALDCGVVIHERTRVTSGARAA